MRSEWPLPRNIAMKILEEYLRRYHRWTISGDLTKPARPSLFVSHHGYGSAFDLNVFAAIAALDELKLDEPVVVLAHELAWRIGLGRIIEPFGVRRASRESALEAFSQGQHVVVMPGGDVDGFKPHRDRNRIVFDDRTGFAQLAIDTGVPVIPIVTSGAGNTLIAISDGRKLASALKFDRLLRLKAIPTTLSIPWGFNVGLVGFAPHLPLPAKLSTRVLSAMRPTAEDDPVAFANRVRATMQEALTELSR